MKQDIQVNYYILRTIVEELKVYREASEKMEKTLKNVNAMLQENKGESIEKLKSLYEEIKIDYDSCHKELEDLENIISEYIKIMISIIMPINELDIVRVDRNDIWWNLETIATACSCIKNVKLEVGALYDFSSIIQDDDEKKRAVYNEGVMQTIEGYIESYGESLILDVEEMRNIFNKKVVPYEDMDDSFATRGRILYNNYSSGGEKFEHFIDWLWECVTDFLTAALDAVVDFIVGLASLAFGLLGGICVYLLDAVFSCIEPIEGDKPEWMKWIHNKKEEYDTILSEITLHT